MNNGYIKPYDEVIGCLPKEFVIEQLNKLDDTTKDLIATKIVELDESNYYKKKYIDILQDRIDKAIKYINEYKDGKPTIINGCEEIEYIESDILLNILRGENNE